MLLPSRKTLVFVGVHGSDDCEIVVAREGEVGGRQPFQRQQCMH